MTRSLAYTSARDRLLNRVQLAIRAERSIAAFSDQNQSTQRPKDYSIWASLVHPCFNPLESMVRFRTMDFFYACGRSQTFGSRPNLYNNQQSKGLHGRANSQLSPPTGPKSLQCRLSERRAIKHFEVSALRAASQQCVKKRDFPSFMTGGTCQDRRGTKSRQGKLLLEKI